MPASGSCIFTDAADYQASRREMLDLLIMRPSEFRARLTWVELPRLRLLRAQEAASRIAYVSLPPEPAVISFPTRRGSVLICNGAELQFGDLVFHRIGERFHQRTMAACDWGTISLTPAILMASGRTIAGQDLAPPRVNLIVRPLLENRRHLLRVHAQAVRIAETNLNSIEHPEVARALEQDLIWALVNCLTPCGKQDNGAGTHCDPGMSEAFEALLAARPHEVLPISEISGALGITETNLSAWSTSVLGMSPDRYVRMRQLKLAYSALHRVDPADANGANIPISYGFSDLHQFVTEYVSAYGEIPLLPPAPRRI